MLVRTTELPPTGDEPWQAPAATVDVYVLEAVVRGVSAENVDGTLVLATDLMVVAAPAGVHSLSDGVQADGAAVALVPRLDDLIEVDGMPKAIKKVMAVPAGGDPAMFKIFVAS